MNFISHKPDLGHVVMPLVRAMALDGLSWDDRAKFAEAIQKCVTHWRSMEDEQRMLNGSAGQQCSSPSATEKP